VSPGSFSIVNLSPVDLMTSRHLTTSSAFDTRQVSGTSVILLTMDLGRQTRLFTP
jgi:hypothetical protein